MKATVAVLGASNNPERYSYKAIKLLVEHGYDVLPVHPSEQSVDRLKCYARLADIAVPVDTVTVYLSEKNSGPLIDEIIALHPRRVILNPGAENERLKSKCAEAAIEVLEACTLVMLHTGQF